MQLKEPFIEKYKQLLGDEAPAFFQALQTGSASQAFRINPLKPHTEQIKNLLLDYEILNDVKDAYLGHIKGNTPLHLAGYVYNQEPSAMLAVAALAPKKGERVLDLCAAPGSKATQIAAAITDTGLLVANEIIPKRAKILAENLERWGQKRSIVTQQAPKELVPYFPHFFDKVLVDAPCSGEGMFRKNPAAIDEWQIDSPLNCAKRQQEILVSALQMLKASGELLYSTCTFSPEENEGIVSWLLDNYPLELMDTQLDHLSPANSAWGLGQDLTLARRSWPHRHPGEGHFLAKFRLKAEVPMIESKKNTPPSKHKKKKSSPPKQAWRTMTPEETKIWQTFLQSWPLESELTDLQLAVFGQKLWAIDPNLPNLAGLKLHKNGLALGTFLKQRFEPAYGLSLAIKNFEKFPTVNLTEADWQAYAHGESFTCPGHQGFVLLLLDQTVIGLGKHVQGTVKNYLPKGLRLPY